MKAKLIAPNGDKNWSLQFFEVPEDNVVRANVWYWARHYGEHFRVSPFKQGDYDDWIMIEFWSHSEAYILEASFQICKELKVELEI